MYANQKPERVHRLLFRQINEFLMAWYRSITRYRLPFLSYPFSKPTNYWYLHLQPIKNATVRPKEISNWSSHLKKIIIKNIENQFVYIIVRVCHDVKVFTVSR